uniref:EB domain-containing protein n=1 Tax=Ditylenchus dipsaci TaxID=166011 RepID=A0A915CRA9_9BILA
MSAINTLLFHAQRTRLEDFIVLSQACRDPTPVYSNGQCLSIAHRDDPCQTDQQCEGGVSMSCVLGNCECKLGFHATNDDRFPSCEKSCSVEEIPVMDKCVKKVPLDGRCVSNKQCGESSECRFGLCQCFCGYKQLDSLLGTRCTNPDDPLNFNNIFDKVNDLFGNSNKQRGLVLHKVMH